MSIVIDASVALKWVLHEPGSASADALLEEELIALEADCAEPGGEHEEEDDEAEADPDVAPGKASIAAWHEEDCQQPDDGHQRGDNQELELGEADTIQDFADCGLRIAD